MFIYYHTPTKLINRNRPITLQLTVVDELDAVEKISLVAYVDEKKITKRMFPTDGILAEESFSVYGATLSAEELSGGNILSYSFLREGESSEVYTVPLAELPPYPSLVITELLSWSQKTNCLVFYNTTEAPLDLYDFELLMLREDGVTYRNPLAEQAGVHVIPAHTEAIFRFLTPAMLNENGCWDEKDAFLSKLAKNYSETLSDIVMQAPLVFEIKLSEWDAEKDQYVQRKGSFDLAQKYKPHTLYVVPRGGSRTQAVFTHEINVKEKFKDVSCRKSTVLYTEPSAPDIAVVYDSFWMPTVGIPHPVRGLPDENDTTVPAILPIAPIGETSFLGEDIALTFAVVGAHAYYPRLFLKNARGSYRTFLPKINNDGFFEVKVPYTALIDLKELEYYIEVRGGYYPAYLGSEAAPIKVPLIDRAGPHIDFFSPAEGQVLENELTPTLVAEYRDRSGVNVALSQFFLDGRNATGEASLSDTHMEYRPAEPLALGKHTAELILRDGKGNRTYKKVDFYIGDGEELQCFIGQVHSHTKDSDGLGTPEEAIRFARDVGEVDFFAVTDHSHHISEERYEAQIALAERYNENGVFAALYGYEMTWNATCGFWGHMNILGSKHLERQIEDVSLPALYEKLKSDGTAVAMFNHPSDAWGDFEEFSHHDDEIDERIVLSEISGKRDRNYALMLTKGWHAAPVYNEDNHKSNWTRDTDAAGVVLAPTLTRENILDAMRRRRTYSTQDRSMRIYYRMNGEWLGSTLKDPETLTGEVELHTKHPQGIGRVELLGEDNIVVAHIDVGARQDFTWRFELDPDFDYYYIRILNGELYTVTAPIFLERTHVLTLSDLRVMRTDSARLPHAVSVDIKSNASKQITDLRADFYLTPYNGFVLRETMPYRSLLIDKIEPGEKIKLAPAFGEVAGAHRVSVIVSGTIGKQRFTETVYTHVSPLHITKILPHTKSIEVGGTAISDPFSYVEISNQTGGVFSLGGYQLDGWRTFGKRVQKDCIFKFGDVKLPPESTLVLWCRPKGATLTAADFNTAYGTALVEGEDLLITDVPLMDAAPTGKRLDLSFDGELLSRVNYGMYGRMDSNIGEDVPILFMPTAGRTETERNLEITSEAIPGKLLPVQKLPLCRAITYEADLPADEREKGDGWLTRLTRAPLVPMEAASLAVNAFSAIKDLLIEK